MKEYIYLIHPLRHDFFEHPTPFEEQVMDEHYQYLERFTVSGKVVLAGPCLDETFGVVILREETDQAAQEFMFNDPSVKSNVMMAELHPMKISLIQGG
jgi:uncharacterized protein YciI